MIKEYLKFLVIGPLLSIFQIVQRMEGQIMGLKETLRGYNSRLETITNELREDFQRLNDKLANSPVIEDVSEELAAMDAKLKALEGLDQPNPDEAQGTPGTIVDPGTLSTPTEATFASPGEPDAPSDDVLPEGS